MQTFETIFVWDSITPFGCPVVPELYTRNARSFLGSIFVLWYRDVPVRLRMLVKCLNFTVSSFSSPIKMMRSSSMPTFLQASMAGFRNAFCVTNALAPESFSWKASSSAV
jgi:hypothetical protein